MKIRALIIEDEELARDLLKNYLLKYPDIELAGEYADGFSGLKGIQEQKPDLIFLDVQMPKLNGFELLELLDDPLEIIFTTAYDQYAIKAFEHNAVDYLLKPFSEERFGEALVKAREKLKTKSASSFIELKDQIESKDDLISRIVVKNRNEIKVISLEQVLYLEAQDDYVMIYTQTGKYLKQKTMTYFENHLNRDEFIRVHRSFLVKADQIIMLEPYGKDSWVAILKNGVKVPVSRSGYRDIKELFDI